MPKDKPLIKEMTPQDIQNKIEEFLPVRKEKKDKNGEVFTPISLIEDMLSKLPNNVWSNPELKWLDPANGIGNFPMVVYQKLFEKLPNTYIGNEELNLKGYKDERGKQDHIIENMLYMVEIDTANVKISRIIFGPNANISCADFLEKQDKWIKDFKGVDKFNIIIGNPPFNASQENEGKKGGGDSLWPTFVKTSINILVNNGYLLFVHPSAWRKPQHEGSKTFGLFNLMCHENQIEYLEIHDTKDGMNVFNVGTRYDWYLLKKHKNNKNTTIKDQKGNIVSINLKDWNFLPNYNFNIIKKILGNSENVIYSRNQFGSDKNWVHATETNKYKYPLIHSIPLSGVRYYWTSTKTPDVKNFIPMFNVSKVIFGESGNINDVIIDTSGKYGLTQEAIGIKIKNENEGKMIKKALMSNKFKDVIMAMSFGNFRIDWRMFLYFKSDFYKHFLSEPLIIEESESSSTNSEINKNKAGIKIKRFITKKHKERKNKTKKSSGGSKKTRKNKHHNKTHKFLY